MVDNCRTFPVNEKLHLGSKTRTAHQRPALNSEFRDGSTIERANTIMQRNEREPWATDEHRKNTNANIPRNVAFKFCSSSIKLQDGYSMQRKVSRLRSEGPSRAKVSGPNHAILAHETPSRAAARPGHQVPDRRGSVLFVCGGALRIGGLSGYSCGCCLRRCLFFWRLGRCPICCQKQIHRCRRPSEAGGLKSVSLEWHRRGSGYTRALTQTHIPRRRRCGEVCALAQVDNSRRRPASLTRAYLGGDQRAAGNP